jgi:hypothetical protein
MNVIGFTMLNRLLELEAAVAHTTLPPDGVRPFTYQTGTLPILVSAPHATAHQRCQRIKKEEGFTGAIAQFLAETMGVQALFSHYRSLDDPNWDRQSPYKECLQEIVQTEGIRFVLDLHGMSNRHKIGLALGTMNGRSCPDYESLILQTVQRQFQQASQASVKTFTELHWDHFVLNHSRFTGGLTSHTITRFASQELQVPALQIELCSAVRVVAKRPFHTGQPEAVQQTLKWLQDLVEALATAV